MKAVDGSAVGVRRTVAVLALKRADAPTVAHLPTCTPLKGRNVVTDVGGQMCSEPYGPAITLAQQAYVDGRIGLGTLEAALDDRLQGRRWHHDARIDGRLPSSDHKPIHYNP